MFSLIKLSFNSITTPPTRISLGSIGKFETPANLRLSGPIQFFLWNLMLGMNLIAFNLFLDK